MSGRVYLTDADITLLVNALRTYFLTYDIPGMEGRRDELIAKLNRQLGPKEDTGPLE